MTMVIFETRGAMAHFRRPDTLGTHATYPFITRTALHGLIASILGRPSLPAGHQCGIRLLSPVATVTQELSMHGKTWTAGSGQESSFSRPTSIELLVNPAYRLYCRGPCAAELAERLALSRSHYHTYLGAAFCLTFPRFVQSLQSADVSTVDSSVSDEFETVSVVPAAAVRRLITRSGRQYARVGGVLYQHLGDRKFRGTINLLYEVRGQSLCFQPTSLNSEQWQFIQIPQEGAVCLW